MGASVNRREFLASTMAAAHSISGFAGSKGLTGIGEVRDGSATVSARPVVDVTDLYHPYEDPGDNFDLVHAYSLPEVDLKAIILDVTAPFRLPVADHPVLWHDPYGPREPGIVPVTQLNAIFDRTVPFAVSPYTAMTSLEDDLRSAPRFQQAGIELLIEVLRNSDEKVDVVSFGSCRAIAAALNREPVLLHEKIHRIHVSAGTASSNYEFGSSQDHNRIPGGEWNVALDVLAFRRLLASDLNIGLYPCASVDGAFSYGIHNTYWNLPDRHFIRDMDPRIRNYLIFALGRQIRADFLRSMNVPMDEGLANDKINAVHHVWETAIWLNVSQRKVVRRKGKWELVQGSAVEATDRVLRNELQPCRLKVREDGRIAFEPTHQASNISIFTRDDPKEYEGAMREVWPAWLQSIRSKSDA